jgi:DNA-binding CsgD family transcriptional regulator
MGAAAFAERARLELAASGARGFTGLAEGDGTRTAETALTERETQIARLVAGGATNAEVASQLFISASTVDYHLRHVYRKLGVRSRTELAVILRGRA